MTETIRNFYELVPRRKREYDELAGGAVEVLLPRYGTGVVGRVLKYFLNSKPVRVRLDDVGARVWRLCDGRRSVLDIGAAVRDAFGERVEPVNDRVAAFLDQMHKTGLIEWNEDRHG